LSFGTNDPTRLVEINEFPRRGWISPHPESSEASRQGILETPVDGPGEELKNLVMLKKPCRKKASQ
jgi:hypothetical protein